MADTKQKVPNLRFKGFTNDWEQHKLGEVCEKTYSGLTGKNKQDFGHGKAKYVTYLNVHDNAIATTKGVDQVEIDPKQNEVVKGDLLFTVSSEVPEEVALNSVWPGTDNNVYLNSFCFGMRPMSKSVNSFFLTYYLRSPQMRRNIYPLAQGISRFNISKRGILSLTINLPNIREQINVYKVIKNIECLITLQQRKLNLLKQLKKGFLQKMFADKNSKQPILRFEEFHENWKQNKLREMVVPLKSYSLTRKAETKSNTGFKYIHYGDIHTGKAKIISNPQQLPSIVKGNYLSLSDGDIVIADASEDYKGIADTAILLNKGHYSIVAGLHTIALHPTKSIITSLFLYYQLNTERFSHYGYRVGTGLKVFGISSNLFFDYLCCYPKISEQIRISKIISILSNTITFQQSRLENLTLLKKFLLQQMFI